MRESVRSGLARRQELLELHDTTETLKNIRSLLLTTPDLAGSMEAVQKEAAPEQVQPSKAAVSKAVEKGEDGRLSHGNLIVDQQRHTVIFDNKPLSFSPTEFQILVILLRQSPGVKVLVIDDDYEICDLMGYTLEVSGYKAIIARNGYEGLELARKHKPDLIITDNHMPFMGGLEMLEVFRKTNIETPVIFMTGFGSENIAIDAFRLGINNYLIKPFKYGEAIEAIEWALREVRLRREKERVERSLLAAEAIQRTVVTLSHHINNQLMVIDLGFSLISEALETSLVPNEATKLNKIVKQSTDSITNISAVLRVLQNISEVEYHDYSDQIEMLNIDEALKLELEQVSRLRAPVALSPSSFIVSQQPLV